MRRAASSSNRSRRSARAIVGPRVRLTAPREYADRDVEVRFVLRPAEKNGAAVEVTSRSARHRPAAAGARPAGRLAADRRAGADRRRRDRMIGPCGRDVSELQDSGSLDMKANSEAKAQESDRTKRDTPGAPVVSSVDTPQSPAPDISSAPAAAPPPEAAAASQAVAAAPPAASAAASSAAPAGAPSGRGRDAPEAVPADTRRSVLRPPAPTPGPRQPCYRARPRRTAPRGGPGKAGTTAGEGRGGEGRAEGEDSGRTTVPR